MIAEQFLRQIPLALQAAYERGEVTLWGSVLRHSNGQIAGYLQETSGLSKVVELVSSGPAAPLKLIGGTIQIVQNEQIKHGLAAVQRSVALLNQLQVANLALGAAGIGVSMVGFAVMNAKIDAVQGEVRALGERIEAIRAEVRSIDLQVVRDRVKQLRGLARSIDQRWSMSDEGARIGWRDDAGEARRLHDFFEGRAEQLLTAAPTAIANATPLLDASTMASGLRVAALALSGESRTAINVAHEDTARLERLTGRIGAADLTRAWMSSPDWQAAPGSEAAGHALDRAIADARVTAASLRQREATAATRAAPLQALAAKGLHPRDWLGAARAEEDAPLLLMEAL